MVKAVRVEESAGQEVDVLPLAGAGCEHPK